MPLYEFKCQRCGKIVEKLVRLGNKSDIPICEECGTWMTRFPSLTASRRDMTVVNNGN
jgi:putative FmdB family regulatory protein